ncbi:hypothetical protein [Aeromicrobium sp.]|uniref:hypothetical protein n=1 Tax=Aeromicrobium sp. TaxID=1871063 RepID=UPI002FCB8D7D
MTKLILAFHGTDLALDDADLRARLAAIGVTRFQLNVDDDPVADALRFGPGAPITAFVTLWTDGDPEAAIAVLSDIDAAAHAWRVTERRPIDPPSVADGARAGALANIAVLRRPEGMTREEYLDIWLGSHTQIAIDTQNTFGYIQNIVEEPLTPGAPEISAIVEELFPMSALTDIHEFYGSGGDDEELGRRMTELMASVARFGGDQGLDLVPTSRYVWDLA